MRDAFKNLFARLRRDERGVTLVEYGIAIGLAVAIGIGALTVLSNDISGAMSTAGSAMP